MLKLSVLVFIVCGCSLGAKEKGLSSLVMVLNFRFSTFCVAVANSESASLWNSEDSKNELKENHFASLSPAWSWDLYPGNSGWKGWVGTAEDLQWQINLNLQKNSDGILLPEKFLFERYNEARDMTNQLFDRSRRARAISPTSSGGQSNLFGAASSDSLDNQKVAIMWEHISKAVSQQ
jgi:hypothetical protein